MRALCEVAYLMGPAWAGTERNVSTDTCSAELGHGVAGIRGDLQLVIGTACRATNVRQVVRVAWLPDPGPVPERQAPPIRLLMDPV